MGLAGYAQKRGQFQKANKVDYETRHGGNTAANRESAQKNKKHGPLGSILTEATKRAGGKYNGRVS